MSRFRFRPRLGPSVAAWIGIAFLASLGAATIAAVASDDPDVFLEEYLKMTLFGVLSDEGRAAAGVQKPRMRVQRRET